MMDLWQLAAFVVVGLVLIVVSAYALSWAIASGWARGKQAVPDPDRGSKLERLTSGGW